MTRYSKLFRRSEVRKIAGTIEYYIKHGVRNEEKLTFQQIKKNQNCSFREHAAARHRVFGEGSHQQMSLMRRDINHLNKSDRFPESEVTAIDKSFPDVYGVKRIASVLKIGHGTDFDKPIKQSDERITGEQQKKTRMVENRKDKSLSKKIQSREREIDREARGY